MSEWYIFKNQKNKSDKYKWCMRIYGVNNNWRFHEKNSTFKFRYEEDALAFKLAYII